MNADRLLAFYERVAEAPDAIARLRRFVLDLAVRGKLVAQDPTDEPASELLKRIVTEKARLVKMEEIRKPRDLGSEEEIGPPFDIPVSWRWCRLDNIGAITGGGTPSAGDPENFAEPGNGIPWLTPADLGSCRNLFVGRGARDLTKKGLNSSSATMMPAGTVLFTSRAPIGYVAIAANPISTNQGFKSIVPYVTDCSHFIALVMRTFEPEINAKAPGTTFKEVSGKIVAGVPFPLPPLREQRRIVATVEELMALLARLKAARTMREAARDCLTAASLSRLTAPDADPADFPDNARFTLATLTALTARPDQIKPLRQTILNLAVRGKLVEQDPADEPASELFKRLKKAQIAAIASEGIRARPPIAKLSRANMWFEFPESWVLPSFDEIFVIVSGVTKGQKISPSEAVDVPYLRVANVQRGHLDLSVIKSITVRKADEERYALRLGDILMTEGGDWDKLGRAAIWHEEISGCIHQNHIFRVRTPSSDVSPEWVTTYVNSLLGRAFFEDASKQTTSLASINMTQLRGCPIPLPPLAEQHRIVAKVDALMALCDRLEAALAQADTTRARLLEALLHEALLSGRNGGQFTA